MRYFEFFFIMIINPSYIYNDICLPESFNPNISNELFDHKITLVNLQLEKKK